MDEDQAIVESFKAGKTEAFSELVHKYKKPILNLIYRMSGTFDEAEDLCQEVFLRAYRGLPKFKAEAKFFTWLYQIAINLTLRARKRKSMFVFQSLEQKTENGSVEILHALSGNESSEEKFVRKELQLQVRKAIMELPEDQREIVILYRYNNISYENIAQILKISLPAVKSRLHRARQALKEKLQPYLEVRGLNLEVGN